MAINFTVSYTFSPSTTISSSQVNTNFSDEANVWTGLEALTKSFAALRVDATPTAATDTAIKSYVDKLNAYRRPVLQYSSTTVVNIETGINGTSGQAQILFPDGTLRTDSTTGRINCNVAQVAALSGSWQSGVRTGTITNNTWNAIYAVKTTDDTAKFVTVADTVLPLQANYATLNSNFGTNGWVYLGLIAYGDNSGTANAIMKFVQVGNKTIFQHACTSNCLGANPLQGIRLATTASAGTLTWTYASGTTISSAQLPANIGIVQVRIGAAAGTSMDITDSAAAWIFYDIAIGGGGTARTINSFELGAADGVKMTSSGTVAMDILLAAFYDGVLGVGASPIL